MGAPRWSNRSISSAHEQALVFCADFAAACKARGDMSNFYRWKMVLNENRRGPVHQYRFFKASLRNSNAQAQLSLM